MNYKRKRTVICERKPWNPIICRSRTRKKVHLTIVVQSGNLENAENVVREVKKTIQKQNRLLPMGVSYEIFSSII